jgi:hypothetical protein
MPIKNIRVLNYLMPMKINIKKIFIYYFLTHYFNLSINQCTKIIYRYINKM